MPNYGIARTYSGAYAPIARAQITRVRQSEFEADASTYFGAMTAPPTWARRRLDNWLIANLKGGSIWQVQDAVWILCQATSQAAVLNAVQRAFDCTIVGSPVFAANQGYTGTAGAGNYLDTTYIPATHGVNLTQDNGSLGTYNRLNVTGSNVEMGAQQAASQRTSISALFGSTSFYRINQVSGLSVANSDTRGMFVSNRLNSSTTMAGYKNGALAVSGSIASATRPTSKIIILGSWNGTVQTSITINQVSLAFVGGGLTAQQVTDFYTVVQSYMTALGINV